MSERLNSRRIRERLALHLPVRVRVRETPDFEWTVDMRVQLLDEKGAAVETEQTVSENIGPHGATLFTTLNLQQGRFVRLTSEQYRTTVHAAIRERHIASDGIARIQVEFIDKEWPL